MIKEDQKNEIRAWCKDQTVERLKEVVEAHKNSSEGARYWLCWLASCELDRRDDISEWKSYVDIADAIKATDVEITGAKMKVYVVVGPDKRADVRVLKVCSTDDSAWTYVYEHSNKIGYPPSCFEIYCRDVDE